MVCHHPHLVARGRRGRLRAPVHNDVRRAIGLLDSADATRWRIGTRLLPDAEVMAVHLAMYRAKPPILSRAVEERAHTLSRARFA